MRPVRTVGRCSSVRDDPIAAVEGPPRRPPCDGRASPMLSRGVMQTMTRSAARRTAIAATGLDRPRPATVTARHLRSVCATLAGDADRVGGSCVPMPLPAVLPPSLPLSARDARPPALLLTADGRRILGARGGLRPTRDLEARLTQTRRMVAGRLRPTAAGDGGGLQEPAEL